MLQGLCAFCGNQTHFTARIGRVAAVRRRPFNGSAARQELRHSFEVAATCDACHRFNVASGSTAWTLEAEGSKGQILDALNASKRGESMTIEKWSPPPLRPVDVSFIPPGVAGFLQEAHDAASIGAYRAVLLLVRSTIEATARDKGVSDGSLVQKINALHAAQHLRTGTKDMAHALRILGNDMAHGEINQVPTQEDADDALIIARFVLDDVYVADARRIDMLERRSVQTGTTSA